MAPNTEAHKHNIIGYTKYKDHWYRLIQHEDSIVIEIERAQHQDEPIVWLHVKTITIGDIIGKE